MNDCCKYALLHPLTIPASLLATDWCSKLATTSPFILLLVDKQKSSVKKMVIINDSKTIIMNINHNPSTLQLTILIQLDGIEHIFIFYFRSILIF